MRFCQQRPTSFLLGCSKQAYGSAELPCGHAQFHRYADPSSAVKKLNATLDHACGKGSSHPQNAEHKARAFPLQNRPWSNCSCLWRCSRHRRHGNRFRNSYSPKFAGRDHRRDRRSRYFALTRDRTSSAPQALAKGAPTRPSRHEKRPTPCLSWRRDDPEGSKAHSGHLR